MARRSGRNPILTQRLLELLTQAGKTVYTAAAELEVPYTNLYDIVFGRRAHLNATDIALFVRCLNVSPEAILLGTEYEFLIADFPTVLVENQPVLPVESQLPVISVDELLRRVGAIYASSASGGLITLAYQVNCLEGYTGELLSSQILYSWLYDPGSFPLSEEALKALASVLAL